MANQSTLLRIAGTTFRIVTEYWPAMDDIERLGNFIDSGNEWDFDVRFGVPISQSFSNVQLTGDQEWIKISDGVYLCVIQHLPVAVYLDDKRMDIATSLGKIPIPVDWPFILERLRVASVLIGLRRNAVAFHSSCIERDGWAWMFCGPSGHGKSTIADLMSGRFSIMSDDFNFVDLQADCPEAGSTPFTKLDRVSRCRRSQARLRGVFMLSKCSENRLEHLSVRESCIELYQNAICPPGHEETIFDLCTTLAARVSVHRLFFTNAGERRDALADLIMRAGATC